MIETKTAQPNKLAIYLAGLALASAGIYDITASYLGEGYIAVPILLSVFAIMLNFDYIKDTIKRTGLGEKWVVIPLLIIWLSCIGHLDIKTAAYGSWFVAVYFLGRSLNHKVFNSLPYAAIVVSLFVMVSKIVLYTTGLYENHYLLWNAHHYLAFLILMGMIFAKGKIRGWTWILGIPAIIIGGSQEGLGILIALLIVWLLTNHPKKSLIPLGLVGSLVAIIAFTGYGHAAFPAFNGQRLDSLNNFTDLRITPIVDLFKTHNWIWGTGWTFDFNKAGSAIHNVVLDMASNIGIVAGLAWMFMIVAGFFKTPYRWVFFTLAWWSIVDNSLWTGLAIWSPLLLGVLTQKEGEYESQ